MAASSFSNDIPNWGMAAQNSLAAIFSLSGYKLTADERSFFKDSNPLGFILFQRNCENPDQLRALTDALKETLGRDCPILIDQEGGRVQRLKPPMWRQYPAMRHFGEIAESVPPTQLQLGSPPARQAFASLPPMGGGQAGGAAMNNALEDLQYAMLQLAEELRDGGINVNCAPCLDVLTPETHDVIGDRAFSSDAETVTRLGLAVCETFLAACITPVVKHMPGHGRATADSHKTLPVVKASAAELAAVDFKPFTAIAQSKIAPAVWGMPTPVLYPALDPDNAACASKAIIHDVIRGQMGFEGVLLSDATDMDGFAAYGDAAGRVMAVLNAGCDLACYCPGIIEDMKKIATSAHKLRPDTLKRLQKAAEFRKLAT